MEGSEGSEGDRNILVLSKAGPKCLVELGMDGETCSEHMTWACCLWDMHASQGADSGVPQESFQSAFSSAFLFLRHLFARDTSRPRLRSPLR